MSLLHLRTQRKQVDCVVLQNEVSLVANAALPSALHQAAAQHGAGADAAERRARSGRFWNLALVQKPSQSIGAARLSARPGPESCMNPVEGRAVLV
jgi:hypothetical protein